MPIKIATPEETKEFFRNRENASFISFLPRKRKQKPAGIQKEKMKKVRDVKIEWAKPDDPIYTTGFVIGGKPLKKPKKEE